MFTPIRTFLAATFKGTCALAFGGAILGMVVRNCDRRDGVVYIHVPSPGVDVTIGDLAYRVESLWVTPIVCTLPPGPHVMRVSGRGTVLHEQAFLLEPGQELVLCAGDGQGGPSRGSADPDADPARARVAFGLTASTRRSRP